MVFGRCIDSETSLLFVCLFAWVISDSLHSTSLSAIWVGTWMCNLLCSVWTFLINGLLQKCMKESIGKSIQDLRSRLGSISEMGFWFCLWLVWGTVLFLLSMLVLFMCCLFSVFWVLSFFCFVLFMFLLQKWAPTFCPKKKNQPERKFRISKCKFLVGRWEIFHPVLVKMGFKLLILHHQAPVGLPRI